MKKQNIGFIGLGIMGSRMVRHLINDGYNVTVYDLNTRLLDPFAEIAHVATSSAEAVQKNEIIITMLPDGEHLLKALEGEQGFLANMKPGAVLIDMSTILPAVSSKAAQILEKHGIEFIDAPVSGGEGAAAQGTLTLFVGGEETTYQHVKPILDLMSSKTTYFGKAGMGQLAKLCNQVVGAVTLQAVCEGLMLASKSGLDPELVVQAMKGGASDSFMLEYVSSRVLHGDMTPGFKISLEVKDLRNALKTAEEFALPLPALSQVQQLFISRVAAGGDQTEGNQALIQAYELLANHCLSDKKE